MKGHIYLIRNLINGKGYVGQTTKTVTARFSEHRYEAGRGTEYVLYRAIRKYGPTSGGLPSAIRAQSQVIVIDDGRDYPFSQVAP
jgi:hypothetical protein